MVIVADALVTTLLGIPGKYDITILQSFVISLLTSAECCQFLYTGDGHIVSVGDGGVAKGYITVTVTSWHSRTIT